MHGSFIYGERDAFYCHELKGIQETVSKTGGDASLFLMGTAAVIYGERDAFYCHELIRDEGLVCTEMERDASLFSVLQCVAVYTHHFSRWVLQHCTGFARLV